MVLFKFNIYNIYTHIQGGWLTFSVEKQPGLSNYVSVIFHDNLHVDLNLNQSLSLSISLDINAPTYVIAHRCVS